MGSLFLDYRDPLFGIMAFLLIVSVVAVLSMFFGKLKGDTQSRRIKRFLQKFPSGSDEGGYAKILEAHPDSFELLTKVAKAHFDGGDFEKALKIYLALLEWLSVFEKAKRAEILSYMGDIYTKSGFLQRSVDAYEQSLGLVARNQGVLEKLSRLYEKRGEHQKALEAVDALIEMGLEKQKEKRFLEGIVSLRMANTFEEKLSILDSLYGFSPYFAREYLKELLLTDQKRAAVFLSDKGDVNFLDILWSFELDNEIFKNSTNPLVKSVLAAKAKSYAESAESGIFELDVLVAAKSAKPDMAVGLGFEFVCQKCGNLDIDYFFSCKCCGAIDECRVAPEITKVSQDSALFLESW